MVNICPVLDVDEISNSLSGDISSVTVFGRPLIILNSSKVAMDILDKKSSKYSDRPVMPMGGELCATS
jgi:hypothetical protein